MVIEAARIPDHGSDREACAIRDEVEVQAQVRAALL